MCFSALCAVAARLVELGQPPLVLTGAYFVGAEASRRQFDEVYDHHRCRVRRVYG